MTLNEVELSAKRSIFQKILLAWYAASHRELPWRKIEDPYAIALSEIMSQQTQVDRVIPKWQAWLEELPTWEAVARADVPTILRLWSGLGYNRRALALKRLAEEVVRRGGLPRSIDELVTLPGIGPYTAAAIAAFAYKTPHAAAVDTNVDRVLRRVYGAHSMSAREIKELAVWSVPDDVASWNHALMDLGASKCAARKPQCASCPLRDVCASYPCAGGEIVKARQKKFEGSDRMFRGRILRVLHVESSVGTEALLRHVGLGDNPSRGEEILRGLVREGFLAYDNDGTYSIAKEVM